MEPLPRSNDAGEALPAPTTRQIEGRSNPIQRLSSHSKGLVDEITSWVELRIKLTQLELEEKVDAKINQALVGAVLGLLALLALVFGLVALALGIGEWLGHPAWGFLVVTILLLAAAGILNALKPKFVKVGHKRIAVDDEKLNGRPPAA